jgi:hypothetical protein
LASVRFMPELFCCGILNQHCVKWNSVRRDDVKWKGIQWSMVTQCEVEWGLVRIGGSDDFEFGSWGKTKFILRGSQCLGL